MPPTLIRIFFWPGIAAMIAYAVIWKQLGLEALFLVIILSILEITLSFDNAVVNARVLERMTPIWQKRFLTWGIAIAVFGTRFVLPILIVSTALWTSPWLIAQLALSDPTSYGNLLEEARGSITAFGGMFLLMVSLKYFFDSTTSLRFITHIEQHFVRWGNIEAVEIAFAICILISLSFMTTYDQTSVLIAGFIGLLLFILMQGVASSLSLDKNHVAKSGLALFIYLNILDAAFSLDGVIGAFAISNNLLIIVVGLGIGAYFVRALTVYMVTRNTLGHLVYLEQGANWAILTLALSMLGALVIHIPTLITGLIGFGCVSVAYVASVRQNKRHV